MPINIVVAKRKPLKKGSTTGSSYKRFGDEFRNLPGAPKDITSIAQVWREIKKEAKDLEVTPEQIKKMQIQPAVNGVITLLVSSKKDKYNVLAKVSLRRGQVDIKTIYKPPSKRNVSTSGPYAQFSRIFRENSSAPVSTISSTWTQIKNNLEPGMSPSDLVVRQEGKKIRIYGPSKKGALKIVETITIT